MRCFQCSKEFEEEELYEVNIGNENPVKMCFLCKIAYNRAKKEEGNWVKYHPTSLKNLK